MSIIQGQKEIEVQTTSQITKDENSPGIEKYFFIIISELVMDRVLEI